jgi:hypothetical protein
MLNYEIQKKKKELNLLKRNKKQSIVQMNNVLWGEE